MTSDASTPAEPQEGSSADAAPPAPRLAPPSGTAAEPPSPSMIARLPEAAGGGASYVDTQRPSALFLGVVSIISLASDIITKNWAEKALDGYPGNIPVWKNHIAFVLAKNKGGAWGLLQGANESVRRPFFLLVSLAAIAFIVTLYRKLLPQQQALKWGLPLVLGGALGNVFDRIRYGSVIDFIDFHIILSGRDHHWPTFNVADIAICVGVGLMAVDMFSAKRHVSPEAGNEAAPAPPAAEAPLAPPVAPAAETKT